MAGGDNDEVSLLAALGSTLAGRKTSAKAVPVIVQVALIFAWHPVMYVGLLATMPSVLREPTRYWMDVGLADHTIDDLGTVRSLLGISRNAFREAVFWPALPALEGAVAYLIYRRLIPRPRATFTRFVRCWWRTCLWGLLAIPLIVMAFGVLPVTALEIALCTLVPNFLVLGPGLLARGDTRTRWRMTRWRPVCPECGYSLRGLKSGRCPECGSGFPTAVRTFRRWAIRRLVWDRASRGSVIVAYVRTLLRIVFCPCRAARCLVVPDRLPRAIRWAAVHLLLFALLGVLLGSGAGRTTWGAAAPSQPMMGAQGGEASADVPTTVKVYWATQSLVAWCIAGAALPLLGILLGAAVPGRHPAAKRAIGKWSLYVAAVIPCLLMLHFGLALTRLGTSPMLFVAMSAAGTISPGGAVGALILLSSWLYGSAPPFVLWATAYALWWAWGVSANPYLRLRGFRSFVLHAALFLAAWVVVSWVLFAPDVLRSLL